MKHTSTSLFSKLALVASLAVTVGVAHADGWRWRTGFPSLPTAALDVRGVHFDDNNSNTYAAVTQARNALYSGIQTNVSNFLLPDMQKLEGFQSYSVAVKGPLTLSLTPSGVAAGPLASLSTFAVAVTVNVQKSFGPINGSCTITVNSGALNLSGNLDVAQGSLTNLRLNNFVPSTSRDCSTNVSWIPIIGSLVDSFANSKVDGILNKGLSAVMGVAHQTFDPVKFAGLNVAIPAGRFMVKEVNFDAGQYVVNNLPYLIASTPVSVRFSEPLPTLYAPTAPVSPDSTSRYIQRDEAFSISFPGAPYGGIKFAVLDNTWFNSYWECKPMKPVCAPPNTQ